MYLSINIKYYSDKNINSFENTTHFLLLLMHKSQIISLLYSPQKKTKDVPIEYFNSNNITEDTLKY